MPLADIPVRSKSIRLVAVSVGLRRSEIDGHFEARLCVVQFLGIWIAGSIMPLASIPVRSESLKVAISVPRDVARLCVVQFLEIRIVGSVMPVSLRVKTGHTFAG